MSDWPLLDIPMGPCEADLLEHCWLFFRRTYMEDDGGRRIDVKDWRGVSVAFSRYAFEHTVSGDKDYRAGLGLHEIRFVRERAERLPWIGPTLAGDAVTEVRHQERPGNRGRRLKRRVLIVTHASYVVVLDRQDDGTLRFRTAFPADAAYLARIRCEGARMEVRTPKEKPQS